MQSEISSLMLHHTLAQDVTMKRCIRDSNALFVDATHFLSSVLTPFNSGFRAKSARKTCLRLVQVCL